MKWAMLFRLQGGQQVYQKGCAEHRADNHGDQAVVRWALHGSGLWNSLYWSPAVFFTEKAVLFCNELFKAGGGSTCSSIIGVLIFHSDIFLRHLCSIHVTPSLKVDVVLARAMAW
jgi:hypothetical protein